MVVSAVAHPRGPWELLALVVLGCASGARSVPTVSPVVQPGTGTLVPYPPPPAPVEEVTADHGEPCRWVDGFWQWRDGRWSWTPGAWVEPSADCRRVVPVMRWGGTSQASKLEFWPAAWASRSKGGRCEVRPCGLDLSAKPVAP